MIPRASAAPNPSLLNPTLTRSTTYAARADSSKSAIRAQGHTAGGFWTACGAMNSNMSTICPNLSPAEPRTIRAKDSLTGRSESPRAKQHSWNARPIGLSCSVWYRRGATNQPRRGGVLSRNKSQGTVEDNSAKRYSENGPCNLADHRLPRNGVGTEFFAYAEFGQRGTCHSVRDSARGGSGQPEG